MIDNEAIVRSFGRGSQKKDSGQRKSRELFFFSAKMEKLSLLCSRKMDYLGFSRNLRPRIDAASKITSNPDRHAVVLTIDKP